MNELNIGNTILRLRKEKNLTQEQLACMVGVSAGAVCKWETGKSTPDIGLLSPLARALNTSLDTLLSFQQDLSEVEVADIKQKLIGVFLHSDYKTGEAKCKEYLKRYPNSIHLKLTVAGLISMYSMISEDSLEEHLKSQTPDKNLEQLQKDRMVYALSLLDQVVESKEPRYRSYALFSIASIQIMLENYEESENALKGLTHSFIDPTVLNQTLLQKQGKNEEAKLLSEKMLLHYLNQSTAMLATMASIEKEEENFERATLYLESLHVIENTFGFGLHFGEFGLCKLNIKMGQIELAAKWFKTYVEKLISTEYDFQNNPFFEDVKLEVNVEGQKILRKKFLQSIVDETDLKVLSGLSDYEQGIQIIKENILLLEHETK